MVWWLRRNTETVHVRRAAPTDRPALAALLADTWRRHGPCAVEEQIALLSNDASLIALAGDEAVGFLGLSPRAPVLDRPHAPVEAWADVRLIAVTTGRPIAQVMRPLLAEVGPLMRRQPLTGLVCLTAEEWLIDALAAGGFWEVDRVLSYLRPNRGALPPAAAVATLHDARTSHLDTVLTLNAAAFEPLWRYDARTVLSWLMTADHAVLAERAGQPLGFALTTLNATDGYAQLIRVATHPANRGQGIGRQLVVDAIRYAAEIGAVGLSLNTQRSNVASRRLYETLGFRLTGGVLSVMVRDDS